MQLQPNEIHIWSKTLDPFSDDDTEKSAYLSADEQQRALHFRSAIHQQRFILARYYLRQILGHYLNQTPASITFAYTENEKPYLAHHPHLQFNLSHSDNQAIYAVTLNHAIGIDIEKMTDHYPQAVAKRFLSPQEYNAINASPHDKRAMLFYRVWTRKEALVKAIGKGVFSFPLSSFSVSTEAENEVITLTDQTQWKILTLLCHDGFQSALATQQQIKKILYWSISDQHQQQLDNVIELAL